MTLLSWLIGTALVLIVGAGAVWFTWKFLVVLALVVKADRNDKKRYQHAVQRMARPIGTSAKTVKRIRLEREPATAPITSLDADDSVPEDEED